MGLAVKGGWLDGRPIRKARKAHRCNYWHGLHSGGRCKHVIQPGELYAEGELNDDAGGFGCDHYCLQCAGPEAQESAGELVCDCQCPEPAVGAALVSMTCEVHNLVAEPDYR